MAKGKKHRRRRAHQHQVWTAPGTISVNPDAQPTKLNILAYGPDDFVEKELDSVEAVCAEMDKYPVLWLDVDGLGDSAVLHELGDKFGLHRLALEDVVNVHQRSKVDIYEGCYFIVLRMLHKVDGQVESEQLSVFLGKNFVLTFQEGIPGDCLEPVRQRLRKQSSRIRGHGADFLAYQLVDAVVDGYFPVLEDLSDRLEELESTILANPCADSVKAIHEVKRDLLHMRRIIWPLREAINVLSRDDSDLLRDETKVFLRDCHDHCIQVVELVESHRELSASLMDIYLSSLSNKMNEVMKVLTVITTIFVPLTFVAGLYGMNFNTQVSPLNMPELDSYWGYPICLFVMFCLACVELWFFWKKGWIFQKES